MTDFNKAFFLKKEQRKPAWRVIDAQDRVLGRLATEIADILRGKNKASYTPHTDGGDYVVIVNAEKVKLTSDKMDSKMYASYSGWIGGYKELSARQVAAKDPTRLITYAVEGMLPKNRLSRQIIKKLKVYVGAEHPHKAHLVPADAGTTPKKARKPSAKKKTVTKSE